MWRWLRWLLLLLLPAVAWPPPALQGALRSDAWQLGPVWANLPRKCQNRYEVHDRCRSPSNSPRLRVCDDAWGHAGHAGCDDYSVGSGYCPVYPPQNPDVIILNESKLKLPSRTDHCMAMGRLANESHMFLCPLHPPIAVILNPKAGMNSLGTWLQFMTTKHRHYRFFTELFELLERRKSASDWLWDGGLGKQVSRQLRFRHRQNLLSRMLFETRSSASQVIWHLSKLLLPPGWCVPCCTSAAGRLVLVLVRNPFSRTQSWFRHRWLSNHRKVGHNTWKDFPAFLQRLAAYKLPHHGTSDFWNNPIQAPLDKLDVVHTLSFEDIMKDPLWSKEAQQAISKRIFPMRVETIDSDFIHLHRVLCQNFNYCSALPRLPQVVPHGSRRSYMPEMPPKLKELWTPESRQVVWKLFRSDFEELGYSQDG